MNNISIADLKEITSLLDTDWRVFIHKTTGKWLSWLEFDDDFENEFADDDDYESFSEAKAAVENDAENYVEIEKWTSRHSYQMMLAFSDQLKDERLKNRLHKALDRDNPFRQFKEIVNEAQDIRQQWFDFQFQRQLDFVADRVEAL